MSAPIPPDPEELLAGFMEGQEQILTAGRKTMLDLVDAQDRALCALADSQEKLAAASDIEWLSRLLRAQSKYTREVAAAGGRLVREAMQP
jgi:hypothetical protein